MNNDKKFTVIENKNTVVDLNDIKKSVNEYDISALQTISDYLRITETINSYPEQSQINIVTFCGHLIEYIDNPSEEVQLAAVRSHWWAIEMIKNPTLKVQSVAIKINKKAICLINNPSLKLLAIELSES